MPLLFPYRYRVPILVSSIIIMTGLAFTAALGWQNYNDRKISLADNARLHAATYAESLIEPLKHQDIWRAYSIIRGNPGNVEIADGYKTGLTLVLDEKNKVFVATRPKDYPIGTQIEDMFDHDYVNHEVRSDISVHHVPMTLVSKPVEDGHAMLGRVLVFYPQERYLAGITRVARQVVPITLLLLLLLVPMGWLMGRRISGPISSLTECLDKLEKQGPQAASCELHEGDGELGIVGRKLRDVLNQLVEKASLEQEMIAEERLAAIGRLSAGVAHEVNNPLAGMMTALDTFKHHSDDPFVMRETIDLLERGLEQIRQTVSALLVQSRRQDRPLNHQDIEDIRSLLRRDFEKKNIQPDWFNEIDSDVPLPSADVRQILINLLINAVQATPVDGNISNRVSLDNGSLVIEVVNSGDEITEEQMVTLFEPFSGASSAGTGLGLWVSAQLTERMNGHIDVESDNDRTFFRVTIPVENT